MTKTLIPAALFRFVNHCLGAIRPLVATAGRSVVWNFEFELLGFV
jgi:hypothetical protein